MYKKFFIKFIILFILILILLYLICDYVITNYDFVISTAGDRNHLNVKHWQETKIKIAEKKSEKGKKLVFIGGSSVLFGINAKEIEDYYKIPVVNFGSYIGYIYLIFEDAKKVLNKNDIVIIPLEYTGYTKKYQKSFTNQDLGYIFLFEKDLYKKFDPERKINCVRFFINKLFNIKPQKYAQNLIRESSPMFDTPYSIKYWNENGDNIAERKQIKEKIDKVYREKASNQNFYYTKKDMQSLENKNSYLNEFLKFAKENDIKVYFIAPTLLINPETIAPSRYNIKELWDYAGYDYLDDVEDSFLDKKYFYDTNYHLTNEGAKLRTKQIIKLMDKYSVVK